MGVIRFYKVEGGYRARVSVRDLLDFVSLILASGLRLGETLAVLWDAVDLDAGTVEVRGRAVRITGQGLVLMPTTKSAAGMKMLALPSWCVQMLRDRSNTQADLKDSLEWCGLPWITSHVFRKTTATLLDTAGPSTRAIADQLGHAQPSFTQNGYMGRKIASTEAAGVLEQCG